MKSEFITEMVVAHEYGKWWSTRDYFVFYDSGTDTTYCVPPQFWTDFASVPRLPGAYLLTGNTEHKAALPHDQDYRWAWIGRVTADAKFRRLMHLASRIHPNQKAMFRFGRWLRRGAMHTAVFAAGWAAYSSRPGCQNYLVCNKRHQGEHCFTCVVYYPAWAWCRQPGYCLQIVDIVKEAEKFDLTWADAQRYNAAFDERRNMHWKELKR